MSQSSGFESMEYTTAAPCLFSQDLRLVSMTNSNPHSTLYSDLCKRIDICPQLYHAFGDYSIEGIITSMTIENRAL